MNEVLIRPAKREDARGIYQLIADLAEYEKALHLVKMTPEQFEEDAFGADPTFETIVAVQDEHLVGMMLFYPRYSTWNGKSMYLEDLVVAESHRRQGIGQLLLDALIALCKERKLALLSWQVLDWNESAIDFYQRNHAELDGEWINCRIDIANV